MQPHYDILNTNTIVSSYFECPRQKSVLNTLTGTGITGFGQLFRIFNFNGPWLLHRP